MPTVRVSRPTNGAVVSGGTHFWAEASDNVGVDSVRFYVDGVRIAEDFEAPFKVRWNASTATRGQHRLSVQAEDAAGNVTTSAAITVTVQ